MTAELHLVAAVSRDLCIGRGGTLPWRIPEDLKHFKALTVGHAIVMGRKTYDSIGRPLPDRTTIVVTRGDRDRYPPGVVVAASFEDAIARAREIDAAPRVVGGGEIYLAAMPSATHLHVTHVELDVPGCDTFFPAIDPAVFVEHERRPAETPGVVFVEYRRAREG